MFLHLEGDASLKITTMKDRTVSIGTALLRERQRQVDEILREYGIDDSIEDITDMASFPLGTVSPKLAPNLAYEGMELAIKAYNSIRENSGEKITQKDKVCDIEASPYDCCYISVDDVGVKHQKEHREENAVKDKKYVENTVIHIQAGEISHCITAVGMDIAFRELLAFLLVNELLENKRLIFLTDGARNIKEYIEKIFSFREYTLILDWLHLEKKTKEFMSMAVKAKSKDEKRGIIRDTLRMLWVGNVDEAISYLTNLKAKNVKNEYRLKELTDYLTRKKPFVPCYAVRHMNGLRTSSNIVEKFNDILVARRQKHNGMSWSVDGSGALAAITSAKMNNELSTWLRDSRISIKLAA